MTHRDPDSESGQWLVELARAVAVLGESIASGVRTVVTLLRGAPDAIRRDWKWICRGASGAAGGGFAMTHGYGIAALEGRTGFSMIGGFVLLVPLLIPAFRSLAREGTRDRSRRDAALVSPPALEERLREQERLRDEIAKRCPAKLSPSLEKRPLVAEELQQVRTDCRAKPISRDVELLLVRERRGRYRVVATQGQIEDDFKEGIVWTANEVLAGGEAFARLLAPFAYKSQVVPFAMGNARYFLVALSGAVLPGAAQLRVSEAATRLLRGVADDAQIRGSSNRWATGGFS